VTILRNKIVETKNIQIIGADYPLDLSESKNKFLDKLHRIVNRNKFSILLYHPPVGFEKAADAG